MAQITQPSNHLEQASEFPAKRPQNDGATKCFLLMMFPRKGLPQ